MGTITGKPENQGYQKGVKTTQNQSPTITYKTCKNPDLGQGSTPYIASSARVLRSPRPRGRGDTAGSGFMPNHRYLWWLA